MWGKKAHQNLSSAVLTLTCAKGQGLFCVCVFSHVQLCNPMDCNPPASSVPGIAQARILGGLPFPSPGTQGSKRHLLHLLHWQVDSLPLVPPGKLKDYSRPFICTV